MEASRSASIASRAAPRLVCPDCHGRLGSENGALTCAPCRAHYPVIRGVPRFTVTEGYTASFGKEWTTFRRTQLDSANGTQISATRFRQLSPLEPSSLQCKTVLEAGCGMGRFLEILAPHAAHVVGADMSRAVESAQENLARFSNVTVVQADLFRLPFESATFDYVYTFGVVHHTPSPRDAVCALARLVRPGGKLTAWVYGRRGPMWIPRPYQAYTKLLALLPDDTKLRLLERYVKIAIPAGRAAFIGRVLRHLLPVQDLRLKGATQDGYDPRPERVTDDLVHEWAWLNAFDMFTPTFVSQHVWKDVESWFRVAGLVDLERSEVRVAVTGTKPA